MVFSIVADVQHLEGTDCIIITSIQVIYTLNSVFSILYQTATILQATSSGWQTWQKYIHWGNYIIIEIDTTDQQ